MVFENKQDWPEKYDISKLISREDAIEKVINGSKTSERRNDRYADAGDEITLKNHVFIIENVYPQQLKEVTEEDAQLEGYKSLDDYKEALTSIHQGAVWNPEQVVWVHEFKEK